MAWVDDRIVADAPAPLPSRATATAAATATATTTATAASAAPVDQARHTAWRLAATFFLAALDPHCAVMPNRLFASQEADAKAAEVVDIGVDFREVDAGIVVRRVTAGEAGQAEQIRLGDQLLAIDGAAVAGKSLVQVGKLLEGARGSQVRLRLKRGRKRFNLHLERRAIARSSVVSYVVGDDALPVGVIRLPQFAEGAGAEVRREVGLLAIEAGKALAAIVIDMRGNTGGWVEEAIATADVFLPEALVATVESRRDPVKRWRTTTGPDEVETPLVLLVDGGCRSSCELLAAGLHDLGRALVIGAPTYGKGTVQAVFSANQGDWSIFVTIARYLGPRGTAIQAIGIVPDVILPALVSAADKQRRESDHDNAVAADVSPDPYVSPIATAALRRCGASPRAKAGWSARLARRDPALLAAAKHGLCLAKIRLEGAATP